MGMLELVVYDRLHWIQAPDGRIKSIETGYVRLCCTMRPSALFRRYIHFDHLKCRAQVILALFAQLQDDILHVGLLHLRQTFHARLVQMSYEAACGPENLETTYAHFSA